MTTATLTSLVVRNQSGSDQPDQPDNRRITEADPDFVKLKAKTASKLMASLRQYVADLRRDGHQGADRAASQFIQRQLTIMRDAYLTAYAEGQQDYWQAVSNKRHPTAQMTPRQIALMRDRLMWYGAASVTKMAREALSAYHAEQVAGLAPTKPLVEPQDDGRVALFNPNHDPTTGEFAPGDGGVASHIGGHSGEGVEHAEGPSHTPPFSASDFAAAPLAPMNGGVNPIYLTHMHGQTYMAKQVEGEFDAKVELAARGVAREAGLANDTVPTYYAQRDGDHYIITPEVPAVHDLSIVYDPVQAFDDVSEAAQERLLLHEYVMGDEDRHLGNYLYDSTSHKLTGIDYGGSFDGGRYISPESNSALVSYGFNGHASDHEFSETSLRGFTDHADAIVSAVRGQGFGDAITQGVSQRLGVLHDMLASGNRSGSEFILGSDDFGDYGDEFDDWEG